jgi:hypothetical protein
MGNANFGRMKGVLTKVNISIDTRYASSESKYGWNDIWLLKLGLSIKS